MRPSRLWILWKHLEISNSRLWIRDGRAVCVRAGSKSGQKFFVTHDGRFFMKTISRAEAKFFRKAPPRPSRTVASDGVHPVQPWDCNA